MYCRCLLGVALLVTCHSLLHHVPAPAQDKQDLEKLEKQRSPKPKEFAIVFSFGYARDDMPKEEGKFEELLLKIKKGGFNVIHCTYSDARLKLCQKHGIQMMVDLLHEDHHVYKSPDKAKTLCEKLKNHPAVWGYNIWNDNIGKTGEGRRRDVNEVRKWDPTHPAYVGTYRTSGMNHLGNADIIGYYDFHWSRKREYHFPHLLAFWKWASERDAWFYRWEESTAGQPGKGNFNRSLYSVNTSLACGMKGLLWFIGTQMMDPKTLQWTAVGQDIIKVNQEFAPLAREIGQLSNPSAIYSTAITKTANNDPLPDNKPSMMPPGLDKHEFPKDLWLQPKSGEFVLGVFQDSQKRSAVFLANHNAYAEQTVTLALNGKVTVRLFNRHKATWELLPVDNNHFTLKLAPAAGELLRFEKAP